MNTIYEHHVDEGRHIFAVLALQAKVTSLHPLSYLSVHSSSILGIPLTQTIDPVHIIIIIIITIIIKKAILVKAAT